MFTIIINSYYHVINPDNYHYYLPADLISWE